MIEIKKFKFASNLEYVHLILDEQKIPHFIDVENLNLFSEDIKKENILQIINSLNLDESEVEVDENFQKDFEDWHSNSLNPGHFTGGQIPFFLWNVKNYPFLLFTICFVPIISIVIIMFMQEGDNVDFYGNLIFIFYLIIAISMLVQWIKYKKRTKIER